MLEAVLTLSLLGLVAGVGLAIASRVLYVWEDPKVLSITDTLPGANCGGCGYAGCAAAAEAIAAQKAPPNVCVVGGFDTAKAVAAIMGLEVKEREPEFAWTSCTYGVGEADPIFTYNGATDCRAAMLLYGGSKLCPIGCIGLGTCTRACQFDALTMGEDNLPVFNPERCVGCGACAKACPKEIIQLTSATRRIIGEYLSTECTAPCQRTCPTGINIPAYIKEVREGNPEKALLIIKERCPLPLVCGYICPAPCELKCRRGLVDEGVAINTIKRFAAEYEMKTGKRIEPYKAPQTEQRIALVGGGAEGLTCAYYLARLGYQPTIFEARAELGGILRYVISESRLPRHVLDHDIKGILETGVEAKTNTAMGRDFTVAGLLGASPDSQDEPFDAVLLTMGGLDSRKVLHPDKKRFDIPVQGLYLMLDFLLALSQGDSPEIDRHVAIVQGGVKSLELARKCRELGAETVTIISALPRHLLPEELQDEKERASEGIFVRPGAVVVQLEGMGDRLTGIVIEEAEPLDPDNPERETLNTGTLVMGLGRFPELAFVRSPHEADADDGKVKWHTMELFRTFHDRGGYGLLSSPEPGRISDSAAVVRSILSGRRLARAIHQHFAEGSIKPLEHLASEAEDILDVTEVRGVEPRSRELNLLKDLTAEIKSTWLLPEGLPPLDEELVRKEAERCLQCGLICYEKSTQILEQESRDV